MPCDIQSLLDDAACFDGLSPHLLNAIKVALFCDVAEGISALSSDNPAIQSIDDGNWYRVIGISVPGENPLPWMSQVAVSPGVNTELVIADPDTGTKYLFQAWGVPPDVQWQLNGTTTDPETPTVINVGGSDYNLVVRLDPDPIPVLEPV